MEAYRTCRVHSISPVGLALVRTMTERRFPPLRKELVPSHPALAGSSAKPVNVKYSSFSELANRYPAPDSQPPELESKVVPEVVQKAVPVVQPQPAQQKAKPDLPPVHRTFRHFTPSMSLEVFWDSVQHSIPRFTLSLPSPPPTRRPDTVRLVVVSDTHNMHEDIPIPAGDIFIHCGDFTSSGQTAEVLHFVE
eukprot:g29923.t1